MISKQSKLTFLGIVDFLGGGNIYEIFYPFLNAPQS